jgi:hypothetical protein
MASVPLESSSGRGCHGSCNIAGTSGCCRAHWNTSALESHCALELTNCVVPSNGASATPPWEKMKGEGEG